MSIAEKIVIKQLLESKDEFTLLEPLIPKNLLSTVGTQVVGIITKLYEVAPVITLEELRAWGFEEERYTQFIDDLESAPIVGADAVKQHVLSAIVAYNIKQSLDRWEQGKPVDLFNNMANLVERLSNMAIKSHIEIQPFSCETLMDTDGFPWLLPKQNMLAKPIRRGHFVLVGMRPNRGKTAYTLAQVCHMIKSGTVDANKKVLWINNEGVGEVIQQRYYATLLDVPISQVIHLYRKHKLRDAVKEAEDGWQFKIIDAHSLSTRDISRIIEKEQPSIVVIDMPDNVEYNTSEYKRGYKPEIDLELVYQWMRITAVKYNCVVMATSQLSVKADETSLPTASMLAGSTTGKQAATDVIVLASNPSEEGCRNVIFGRVKEPVEGAVVDTPILTMTDKFVNKWQEVQIVR